MNPAARERIRIFFVRHFAVCIAARGQPEGRGARYQPGISLRSIPADIWRPNRTHPNISTMCHDAVATGGEPYSYDILRRETAMQS